LVCQRGVPSSALGTDIRMCVVTRGDLIDWENAGSSGGRMG
jgi:hypothetical protein